MQDPRAFTSNEYFAARVVAAAHNTWPDGARPSEDELSLAEMFTALTRTNDQLAAEGRRLLLALDEYAEIDRLMGVTDPNTDKARLTEDLLAAIRESIQTHRRIIWMFAGSSDINELTHAPWTSYLVSARTIEVPLFTPEETYALLTEPLRYSPLWPRDDPKRPHYDPGLWGEGGIARIHEEAGGWPHLVQLIAETVVDLLNEGTAAHADAALLERALDKAIDVGKNVLSELMEKESRLPGEWAYLTGFRRRDTQTPSEDEAIYRSLRRRLLVIEENGLWRLRVPLMQRWLRTRG